MVKPVKRPATYEDIIALPEHVVGEILDDELYVSPRPATPHAVAASALLEEIGPAFKRGRGGPGGWMIVMEPELHFGRDVVVPDLAGWRRERMPEMPDAPYITLAPDWVCEALSPSTARIDRIKKYRLYARERVGHLWYVDATLQTLEVHRLDGDTYRGVLTAEGNDKVRAEPFEAIELDLAILWQK